MGNNRKASKIHLHDSERYLSTIKRHVLLPEEQQWISPGPPDYNSIVVVFQRIMIFIIQFTLGVLKRDLSHYGNKISTIRAITPD